MTQLTDQELDALIDAEAKATRGPWNTVHDVAGGFDEVFCRWHTLGPFEMKGQRPNNDELFLLALRNAAPRLLAEVKAARGIFRRLSESLWLTHLNECDIHCRGKSECSCGLDDFIAAAKEAAK